MVATSSIMPGLDMTAEANAGIGRPSMACRRIGPTNQGNLMAQQSASPQVLDLDRRARRVASGPGSQPPAGPLFTIESHQLTDGVRHDSGSPGIVCGWVIPPEDRDIQAVELWIGDEVMARARLRTRRADVAGAYPDRTGALWSGFDTEVALDRWVGQDVDIDLVAHWTGGQATLARIPLKVVKRVREQARRERSFDLPALLACPTCGSSKLSIRGEDVRCGKWRCGARFAISRGSFLFTKRSEPAPSRQFEENFTHAYSERSRAIIRENARGLVLDFGSGNPAPDQQHPNVVLHEALHYPQIDVVCGFPRLPYRDGVFDAVVSQAVFEHISRPWETASELYRVLKPGGRIHLDTAFMQPFHGDPSHYFNMTTSGVRQIFHQFREVSVGVKPYQAPSLGYRMQFDVMLQHLKPGQWHDRVQQFLEALHQGGLDDSLDALGHRYLAAGVYFEGLKPA
jgi:SAM-dependent methyltransferase